MKQIILLLLVAHSSQLTAFGQNVAISNNGSVAHTSAMLDIQSTTKGLLIPRMTTGERSSIANPASGLTIYNTITQRFEVYNNRWMALQPEFPPGTAVVSDSITNAPLAALGFTYAGYFEQHFNQPPQPVTIGGNGWFKINQAFENNAGAPHKPAPTEGEEPDMTDELVISTNNHFVYFNEDSVFHYDPSSNSWSGYWVGINQCRYGVWTGTEVLGWNGYDSLFKYDPASHVLTRLRPSPLLSNRVGFSLVWTGTEMIVWGGKSPTAETYYSNGAIFNPATNTWTLLPVTSFPARAYHSAVWTGTQMIIHGGETSTPKTKYIYNSFDPFNPGYDLDYDSLYAFRSNISYTRSTNNWSAPVSLFTARSRHSAVWTGTEMLVFGGMGYQYNFSKDYLGNLTLYDLIVFSSGFRQNPSSGISQAINGHYGRYQHTAVWDGTDMRLIGGYTGAEDNHVKEVREETEAFRPSSGLWSITSTLPGGVVKTFVPYAFYQDGKIYAFGQTKAGKEQGYVRSFTGFSILQATAPISKRIYLFKKN